MTPARQGITRFGLSNFKAFHYLDDIELRPLTVLVGPNSSGKSSILQSLALLAQTLRTGDGKVPLLYEGPFVRLQSYETIVSCADISKEIEYRFLVDAELPVRLIKDLFPERNIRVEASQQVIRHTAEIKLKFGLPRSDSDLFQQTVLIKPLPSPELDVKGHAYVFTSQSLGVSDLDTYAVESLRVPAVGGSSNEFHGFPFRNFLPEINPAFEGNPEETLNSPQRSFFWSSVFVKSLRHMLYPRFRYLGPVRADPQPFYPVSPHSEVGARGEGAIPYLLHHQNDSITYFPAPNREACEGSFLEALNHWLGSMGVTNRLTIDGIKDIAYTAKLPSIASPGKTINLAQVGFGISQILPVLILGLSQPNNGFLLYEQPEIHLHPRMQADLGDFFLSVARHGKTILLETHSDYLVNRLRRRIAEEPTGELAKLVNILFVHPGTTEHPSSYVEPLEIGSDGSIKNCPSDFFSEGADESFAILRARAKKA